ncbi:MULTISPECIES: putative glutamine/gamma-aminobutyrate antiporter GadC [Achromobacter]|jgi:putative glutamate/gamma-aminobutyrate antiporter|uniref:Glutamate/gamma-aminobutyrate antiporter n=2 Tax=Achromobacter kerstersii TaxID=1353890 RepID=A0A6S7ARK7_9BURK|nr:putative glutamine/gamma-aminobutyrate antiporter GadC [Achromobacter kerstersii]CAB3745057.1 Glutamate/gamma-aminobutyrate antiporter [Achromobacter kerstersii]
MPDSLPNKAVSKPSLKKLGIGTVAIMNIVAVVSLRGLPAEAEYGLSSIFYYLFAAVFFLIPVSLVAAELATGWSEKGGIFRWVGEAFGPRLAFLAMFMLWVEVTVWFPTALTFGAVSLAFIGPDQRWDEALSANKYFILAIVLGIYWLATFIAFRGVETFAKVSKWGGIVGTIIPAIILIVLGFSYLFAGNTPQIKLSWGEVIPDFTNFDNIVLAASIFLFYAGMEMNAIHVQEVDNPKRNYPIAIMLSAVGTVLIFVLGTLAIAFVIPQSDINLTQSLLVAYNDMFKWAGVAWLGPVVAVALAIGVLAGVVTWVAGPSSGLLVVAKAGYLPRWWQHTNAHGMATHILLLQAVIVSLLATLFVVLPSVQAVYQMLSQLTVILYLVMYLLMFSAAIYLRRSQPDRPRPYRIPGGDMGMYIIGGAGFVGSLLAFVFSFIPPSQISVGSPSTYVEILVGLTVFFCIIPFLIYMVRKPGWRDEDSDFAPFTWQAKQTVPSTTVTGTPVATSSASPAASGSATSPSSRS